MSHHRRFRGFEVRQLGGFGRGNKAPSQNGILIGIRCRMPEICSNGSATVVVRTFPYLLDTMKPGGCSLWATSLVCSWSEE